MLNNSTSALVADNTFRNLRGSAVHAGFIHHPNPLPVEGCGSRDYLIRDNKMHNCGSKAINVTSDAGIGGNIIIKNNTISYSSKSFWNGIAISGNNDGVVIKDNLFQSPKAPERGPWIISVNNDQTVQLSNNHIDPPHPNVPIFKEQKK